MRHLDPKLTRDEVAVVVKSLNTRRNLTMTQKIVSAYRQQVRTKETNEEVAGQWAISPMSLKNMKYIAKHRPDLVTSLFNGNTVTLIDPSSKVDVVTSKISTIAKIVKKQVESATLVVDTSEEVEYSVDSKIKTEEGKEWYYFQIHQLGITDVRVRILLTEMANLKFKADGPSLLETLDFTMDSSDTSEESLEED